MRSSISHFKARVPWLAAWLLVVAVSAWGLSRFYTLRLNPEVVFWRDCAEVKKRWARKLAQEPGPRVLLVGGSSCLFSIDAGRLLARNNVRAINMGLSAGLGARFLACWALSETKPGDTLILAVEPDLWMGPFKDTSLALQLSVALDSPALLRAPWPNAPAPEGTATLALRPGAYHTFTLIGKFLKGDPLYRYRIDQLSESGWQQSDLNLNFQDAQPYKGELSDDARALLKWLRHWSETHHVRLAYSMPWIYVPADRTPTFQEHNRRFLLQVAAYIPVLKDPTLGVYSVREHFSDTALHLTVEGAALRTDTLAEQLLHWSVWSREELSQGGASDPPSMARGDQRNNRGQ